MSERQTIADSKRAFHRAFPYVIPPIYRRVADELLVELHLLSHQKDFKVNGIFAIGVTKVFDSFTRGYRPEQHTEILFEAICKSNGFEPASLRAKSEKILKEVSGMPLDKIEEWIRKKGVGAPKCLGNELVLLSKGKNHYSRLISIGILTLLKEATSQEKNDSIDELIKETSKVFGYPINRVERDINQYSSNLEKISQALELMKETAAYDKRKKEKLTLENQVESNNNITK